MQFNNIPGKLTLKRHSTTVRDTETNEFRFSVSLSVERAEEYPESIAAWNPEAVFVVENKNYIKVANMEDYLNLQAHHPSEIMGYYRASHVVRTFDDPAEALAWTKFVQQTLEKQAVQLKDYLAVFADSSETVVVPDDFIQRLYDKIQLYQQAITRQTIMEQRLAVTREKVSVLEEVYPSSFVETPEEIIATGKSSVEMLKTSLPNLKRSLDKLKIHIAEALGLDEAVAVTGGINTADHNAVKVMADLNAVGTARAMTSSAKEAIDAKVAAFADKLSSTEMEDLTVDLESLSLGISAVNTSLNLAQVDIVQVKKSIDNFKEVGAGTNNAISIYEELMGLAEGEVMDIIPLVNNINTIKGIKANALVALRVKLKLEEQEAAYELEQAIRDKQAAFNEVRKLDPDVDPNNPMRVFHYRVFRTPSTD